MNLTEVKKSLDKLFAATPRQGAARNIVFWYDDNGAFAEEVDALELDSAKTVKLYDDNQFAVKLYIEREDTQNNLLVYSPMPRPADRDNWLADTLRYSRNFATDEASLILIHYKMDVLLRPAVREYAAFFRNNERICRFDGYGVAPWAKLASDTEDQLDIAVHSALCKLSVPNLDSCVRAILNETVNGESGIVDAIGKFGSMNRLWSLIRRNYSYSFEEQSFERLAVLLLVTHFAHSFDKPLPKAWDEYNAHNTNCFVLVDGFMKDVSAAQNYKDVGDFVAKKLDLTAYAAKWGVADMLACDTFPQLDEAIITHLRGNILSGAGEYGEYKKMLNVRRNRRWFSAYEKEYDSLYYAGELFALIHSTPDFSAASTKALWNKYKNEYYRFDYFYRKFLTAFDALEQPSDWNELADKVEATYTNGFLSELSVKWCELLDEGKDGGGVIPWAIPGCEEQARFYSHSVSPFVRKDERIVVIVSDGLRYESAVELTQRINHEFKCECRLTEMLGVIPSYTALGMAALLPHKAVEISDKGEVFVDGINAKAENREKILKTVKQESVAITFEKVMGLGKQLPETLGGVKLIYVYHKTIDARGDNASTEREVFDATEKAFSELISLIRRLTSGISAINIFLTADHGYLYRRTPLQVSDKTPKNIKEPGEQGRRGYESAHASSADSCAGFAERNFRENSIEATRRFIMTKTPAELQGTQKFSMRYLGQSEITAVVPRGANVFSIQGGGLNYVHGGSSLQEVMVPLIKFKSGKNYAKLITAQKVTISLSSLSREITSVITHLEFFQNEPVGEKLLPLRIKAFFEDSDGNRITGENIIIVDSANREPAGRAYREKFTLRNTRYDKNRTYYLVLKDDEDMMGNDIMRVPYTIDLVFGGGIQF